MEFPIEVSVVVVGFMILANRLVSGFITPIFDKYNIDKFWLMYVAWGLSGLLVWLSGVNLFEGYIPDMLVGQILTAVVAGGGANIIHDLKDPGEE